MPPRGSTHLQLQDGNENVDPSVRLLISEKTHEDDYMDKKKRSTLASWLQSRRRVVAVLSGVTSLTLVFSGYPLDKLRTSVVIENTSSQEEALGSMTSVVLVSSLFAALYGVYVCFFKGLGDTEAAILVRKKKGALILAQMSQTLLMEEERRAQAAYASAHGGALPPGEERKAPPVFFALLDLVYDQVEERHTTEMGVEALGDRGRGEEYRRTRELFGERLKAELKEVLTKTMRARANASADSCSGSSKGGERGSGHGFASEPPIPEGAASNVGNGDDVGDDGDIDDESSEAGLVALARFADGGELRAVLKAVKKFVLPNFSRPLVTDVGTYPALVGKEVEALYRDACEFEKAVSRSQGNNAIFAVLRPQLPTYVLGMVLFLVESSVGPALWARMYTLFDDLESQKLDPGQFFWLLVRFFIKWVFFILCHVVGQSFMTKANSQFALNIRTEIMNSMMRQDTDFFDRNPSGVLQERLNKDAAELGQNLLNEPKHLLRCLAVVASNLWVLYTISPRLTLLAFVPVPVVVGVQHAAITFRVKLSRRLRNMGERAAADTAEVIKEIRTVREFAKEAHEAGAYASVAAYRASLDEFAEAVNNIVFGWPLFLVFMANRMQAMYFSGSGVYEGQLSIGVAMQFTTCVTMVSDHLRMVLEVVPRLVQIYDPLARVNQLLLAQGRIEPQPHDVPKVTNVSGTLEFRDVHFAVPDKMILSGLSFSVEPGQTVGFCGSAGCGKSTTINLVKRFYNPTGGSIYLGGRPISDYDLHALRSHISVVSQENVLFSTTIRENILYGLSEAAKASPDIDARIEEACRKASIWNDINALFPRKLESFVGEKGFKLSGGQKQRLAIARAMIREPRFLMLDEPTAALDSVNEKVVQTALEAMMAGNKTGCTLMIAHRLTTIMNCAKIVVMDRGAKVEEGTHAELLKIPTKKEKRLRQRGGLATQEGWSRGGGGVGGVGDSGSTCTDEEQGYGGGSGVVHEEEEEKVTVSGFYRELWETQNGTSAANGAEVEAVAGKQGSGGGGGAAEKWLRHLETRVRKLELENSALRKNALAATPGQRMLGYSSFATAAAAAAASRAEAEEEEWLWSAWGSGGRSSLLKPELSHSASDGQSQPEVGGGGSSIQNSAPASGPDLSRHASAPN